MRAYLVDPHKQTVEEVEYSGNYKDIPKLLGCDLFDLVRFGDDNDAIYVDDEGLSVENQVFFKFMPTGQILAGRGLVLGCDDEGTSTAPTISFKAFCKMIAFEAREVPNPTSSGNPAAFDLTGQVIRLFSQSSNATTMSEDVGAALYAAASMATTIFEQGNNPIENFEAHKASITKALNEFMDDFMTKIQGSK